MKDQSQSQEPAEPIGTGGSQHQQPYVVHFGRTRGKTIAIWTLVVLLAAGAGVAGFLFYDERQKTQDLQRQIVQLQQTEIAPEGSPTVLPQEELTEETSGAEYTATVGDFALQLPAGYVIVRAVDGGYEGGPTAALEVGRQSSSGKNVIDAGNPLLQTKLNVTAKAGASFEQLVQRVLDGSPDFAAQPDVQVSGVTARVYDAEGLVNTRYIFFEKNDYFYAIEAVNVEQESVAEALQLVISGFSFN